MARKTTVKASEDFSFDVMDEARQVDETLVARPTRNGEPSLYVYNEKVAWKLRESWAAGHKPLSVSLAGRNVGPLVASMKATLKRLQETETPKMGLSLKWSLPGEAASSKMADVPDDATPVDLYFTAVERKDSLTPEERKHALSLGFTMPAQQTAEDGSKFYATPTLREQYRRWEDGRLAAPSGATPLTSPLAAPVAAAPEPVQESTEDTDDADFSEEQTA